MQVARVIGDVVATMKEPQLVGHKLLVLQPISPAREAQGRCLIAIDACGAGVGEEVFFVRGKEASFPFLPAETPVDACVVGIIDAMTVSAPGTSHQAPSTSTQHLAPSTST